MSRRPTIVGFVDADGVRHELRDPDGPASAAQLRILNEAGRLELVGPGEAIIITKAEAAHAVAVEVAAGRVELSRRRSSASRDARTWEAIVAHVRQHPGGTGADLHRAVRGKRVFVRDLLEELIAAGVIVNTGPGPGRRLELWHRDDPRRQGDRQGGAA